MVAPLPRHSQKSVYALFNEAAKKPIMAITAMEILLHTHRQQVDLAPRGVKREYNTWADELTHPGRHGFDTVIFGRGRIIDSRRDFPRAVGAACEAWQRGESHERLQKRQ